MDVRSCKLPGVCRHPIWFGYIGWLGIDHNDVSKTCPQRVHHVSTTCRWFTLVSVLAVRVDMDWLQGLNLDFSFAWCMTRQVMVFVRTPLRTERSASLPTLQTLRPKRNLLVSCHIHSNGFCFSILIWWAYYLKAFIYPMTWLANLLLDGRAVLCVCESVYWFLVHSWIWNGRVTS